MRQWTQGLTFLAFLCADCASGIIEPDPLTDAMVEYWLRSGVVPGGLLSEYWTSAVPSHAEPRLQVCVLEASAPSASVTKAVRQVHSRDAVIDFDWTEPPGLPAAPEAGLGVGWNGFLVPERTGDYMFVMETWTAGALLIGGCHRSADEMHLDAGRNSVLA